jgi:hypothetical protein
MNHAKKRYFTRRELLGAAGAVNASFLLSHLVTQRSYAQDGKVPQRVVFILSQNGVMTSGWNVTGGAASLNLGGVMTALNEHSQDMVAIDGMRYRHTGGHVGGSLTFLTNQVLTDQNDGNARAAGQSLDHHLAEQLRARGASGPNLLLTTTAGSDQWGGGEFITYEGPQKPIKSIAGAEAVFERVFGSYSAIPTPDAPALPPDWVMRSRRSVTDFALRDYEALGATLGPSEKAKLDELATSIRELEDDQLAYLTGMAGGAACEPGENPGGRAEDADVFARLSRVVAEALSCGETSVATIRFSHGPVNNSTFHSWHHGEGSPSWEQEHNDFMAWQAQQVSDFISLLKSKPAGTGSLLDHTLVVWCNEIGVGGAQEHGGLRLPLLLAGSMGGRIKTNQLISVPDLEHSTLLASVAQAMDVDIDGFGNMDGCTPGTVPGLLT